MANDQLRPIRARTLVPNVCFAVLAGAAAVAAFWPVYQDRQFIVTASATLAIGAAIAVLGAVLRANSAIVAGMVVFAYFLFGVPLGVPGEAADGVLPTTSGLGLLTQASWGSWKQLVTISLPVGSYQALLVPVFILLLLSTTVSLTVALRSRIGEFAVVSPLIVFAAAIALGPGAAFAPFVGALGILVVVIAWLVWFRVYRHGESIRALAQQSSVRMPVGSRRLSSGFRTLVSAAVIVILAGGAGTAAALAVPGQSPRKVIRTSIAQPFDPRDYPSPLSGFRAYLEPDRASEPILTVRGLPADRRIRIATLDTYNGVVYSVGSGSEDSPSGSFTRVPFRLSQAGVRGVHATMEVTVDDYSGPWVPGSGQLTAISFGGANSEQLDGTFFYNNTTGTGAVTGGLRSGDRYTVSSVVKPMVSAAQLEGFTPGTAQVPRPTVIPDQLDQTLQQYVGKATLPGAKLAAALKALAANGYISHGIGDEQVSRSGHGADRITQLLTDVPMIGDAEQYAVTAALMARELGFPARVVFGLVAPEKASLAGPVTLTGSDISAWIEVQTKQDGWVTIDPNPPVRPIPPQRPQAPTQISRPQTDVQPQTDNPPAQNSQAPKSHVDNPKTNPLGPFLAILFAVLKIGGWVLLALAVVCAPFLAIIGAKWRRRAIRRSSPTALGKVAGGWREYTDIALDHGYDPGQAATRREFASTIGGEHSFALAVFADRAVFGDGQPSGEDADEVWRTVADLRKELDADRSRWARFRARISLRSLGGYRSKTPRRKGE
jgi:transglutaminase-like putative cysteine protease